MPIRSGLNAFTTTGAGGNVATIAALSRIDITSALVVDAQTQPGWTLEPRVEVRGDAAGSSQGLLNLSGGAITLRGLIVNRYDGEGIKATGTAGGHVIQGCWVGINATGTATAPISLSAIWLSGSGSNHVIGGTTAAQRNVLGGATNFEGIAVAGGSGHLIQGNYIGTDASGTVAMPVKTYGIKLYNGVSNSTIGGTANGAGNVVSGSLGSGIYLNGASAITVQGNLIGTNASGSAAIANAASGILVEGSNHLIGGTSPAARNVVSGNGGDGLNVSGTGHTIQGNTIGTNAAGNAALGNAGHGITAAGSGHLIGGVAAGNVVSGNAGFGVRLTGTGITVAGNLVGTDRNGTAALANASTAVVVDATATGTTIGGSNAAAGNVITGRNGNNMGLLLAAPGTVTRFNRIGTNAAGTSALGAPYYCVQLANTSNNLFRDNQVAGCNLGLWVADGSGHQILGNLIGTDAAGTGAIGNVGEAGIFVTNGASNHTFGSTTAGDANTIANNSIGIAIRAGNSALVPTGQRISGNRIFANVGLGIDLWTGYDGSHVSGVTPNDGAKTTTLPNQLMDSPVFTSARARGNQLTVAGYVGSAAGQSTFANSRVEIFASDGDASGFGEGQTYLGFITTDANGNFSGTITMTAAVLKIGTVLTGTATDSNGNTSEFGANFANLIVDLVVNDKGDAVDANPGDGLCATAGGVCTLRAAIAEFNALPAQSGGTPTLAFALPGCSAAGQAACSIAPTSVLPTTIRPMVIDAQTQPGWTQDPIVELNGTGAGSGSHGIQLGAAGSGLRGLIINRFGGAGVVVQAPASGSIVAGNWVGLTSAGTGASGNGGGGIFVAANTVTVGGNSAAARNVVSANTTFNVRVEPVSGTLITGNYIGTNAAGAASVGNPWDNIQLRAATNTQIGGTAADLGNVISGGNAGASGIAVFTGSTGTVIQGNTIGRDVTGAIAIPNGHGVWFQSGTPSAASTVGGTGAGAGNLIASNALTSVTVVGSRGVTIAGNRIFANTTLGIDLSASNVLGDGVTANDGITNAAQANNGMDHPVLNGVGIANDGASMTVTGTIGTGTGQALFAGARVEIFKAARDPSGFGEGQLFLGSLTADANGRFSGSFPITVGSAVVGDDITATATDTSGNTSEFGPVWTSTTMAGLAPAGFNAFDPETSAGAITGLLRSRTAGSASGVDVLALDSTGAVPHSGFTGSVSLSWLDARDDSGAVSGSCRSSWVDLGSAGTAAFASSNRVTVSLTPPASGTRRMRLRMSYAGPTGTVTSCSSDDFTALPAQLAWTGSGATDADSATSGLVRSLDNASASGGVVHRAGRPFSLRARALSATGAVMTGYDGSPVLSIAGCDLPSGCSPGTLGGGQVSASAGLYAHDTVSYPEVGAIRLRLTDSTYAQTDSTSGALPSLVTPDITVGRFVPDSYTLSITRAPVLATANAACMDTGQASTFFGQGFGWSITPQITVTARNAAGNTTTLWAGTLVRIPAAGLIQTLSASGTGSTTLSGSFGSPTVQPLGAGQARLEASGLDRFVLEASTPQTRKTPGWSYSASLQDASEAAVAGNPTLAASTSTSGFGFHLGGDFYSGRLSISGAFGDARTGVRALMQLQRWTDAGWVTMTEDRGCVTVTPANLQVEDPSGVFATAGLCAAPMTTPATTRGGRAWISLPASPGGATGRLKLRLAGTTATGSSCVGGTTPSVTPLGMPWLLGGINSPGPANLATWGFPLREPTLRREFW